MLVQNDFHETKARKIFFVTFYTYEILLKRFQCLSNWMHSEYGQLAHELHLFMETLYL